MKKESLAEWMIQAEPQVLAVIEAAQKTVDRPVESLHELSPWYLFPFLLVLSSHPSILEAVDLGKAPADRQLARQQFENDLAHGEVVVSYDSATELALKKADLAQTMLAVVDLFESSRKTRLTR